MSATGNNHIVDSDPWQCYSVLVDALTDRNASVASARFHTHNKFNPYITATGSAKRIPGDRADDVLGEQLAVGRALVSLGQYLIDAADSALDD